jgi:hypothetical protein
MDKSNWTIDDYIKKGDKSFFEVTKTMAKWNLLEHLKKYKQHYDNRHKI